MALQSGLFRGDQRLEGAATSDAAHVMPGSSGPHVRKIQSALLLADNANIATGEFSNAVYGESTAKAVLAYKQRRNIINRAYQSQADNIVGKMTIASLDRDMLGKRLKVSRSGCDYGPRLTSNLLLNFVFADTTAQPVQLSGSSSGVTSSTPTPLELALAAAPAAIGLRREAAEALNAVIDNDGSAAATLGAQALTRHYKVSSRNDIVDTAKKVREFLARCLGRFLSARAWLRTGVGTGFAETPQPRDGHTYILPGYATAGNLMRPLVLVHEAFHDLDNFHQDFGGNPANDQGARYHQNSADIQLQNAYALSQFVLHIHEKRERFLEDQG